MAPPPQLSPLAASFPLCHRRGVGCHPPQGRGGSEKRPQRRKSNVFRWDGRERVCSEKSAGAPRPVTLPLPPPPPLPSPSHPRPFSPSPSHPALPGGGSLSLRFPRARTGAFRHGHYPNNRTPLLCSYNFSTKTIIPLLSTLELPSTLSRGSSNPQL